MLSGKNKYLVFGLVYTKGGSISDIFPISITNVPKHYPDHYQSKK